jgi:small-conductance mechanosensitive channel
MPFLDRILVVAGVLVLTALVAQLIDHRMAKRLLAPEAATRYRVLRRTITAIIFAFGILSALLVIPQVRAVAGGILASSAVLGLVVGFAARSTLANAVAGLLIAFSQPVRLGDRVEVDGEAGTVEEIGLTYTFIRTTGNSRLVIPNEKLASDTIRNLTIVSREQLAEVAVQVPLDKDLGAAVEALRSETAPERAEVLVTGLEGAATVTLRAWAPDEEAADLLASELRLRAHKRLHAEDLLS